MGHVEPGVVLDELNREAVNHALFRPDTSTSNRCCLVEWLVTIPVLTFTCLWEYRDHMIEAEVILSMYLNSL
jgi:hypothetical protein